MTVKTLPDVQIGPQDLRLHRVNARDRGVGGRRLVLDGPPAGDAVHRATGLPQKIAKPGNTGGPSVIVGPSVAGRSINATSGGAWAAHNAVMGPLAVTAVLAVPPLISTAAPSM